METQKVMRGGALGVVLLLGGCAASGTATQAPAWQARLDEQVQAQTRLELRLEEVTRNLLVLRERVEVLEGAVAQGKSAQAPLEQPSWRVVKLEPPAAAGGASAPSAAQPEVDDGAAADLYRRAYNAYLAGRFGPAILDFEDFLQRYSDHEYADNAQYWIGESYYSQGEFKQSVVEFHRVLDRYPHEAKAPDAVLKIGLAYEKMGDVERARVFWQRVLTEHPQSEASVEARKRLDAAK